MTVPTYPGVYVQELPSGVRTITGVATSITAFVGRAPIGPVCTPVLISSYADYQRAFGGLSLTSTMSYAVNDFFQNGGSQAVVVRLYKPQGTTPFDPNNPLAGAAQLILPSTAVAPGLTFTAASPGSWGNQLTIFADTNGIPSAADVTAIFGSGLTPADLFNVTVQYGGTGGPTERWVNVTLKDGPRRLDRVLSQSSQYLLLTTSTIPTTVGSGITGATLAAAINSPSGTATALANGADSQSLDDLTYQGGTNGQAQKIGIYSLENTDLFNLLCIPPDLRSGDTDATVLGAAMAYCVTRRAVLIIDPPSEWTSASKVTDATVGLSSLSLNGLPARNAAIYFPRLIEADPLRQGQPDTFPPCGAVAGLIAATDAQRGVWKAPAGVDAALQGIQSLAVRLVDADSGQLNPIGVNCLRTFPVSGSVIWGARTLRGADQLADDYKYLPVRRLALYIEESLYRGTQWVVFEPNDTPLWAQIRLNVGSFMGNLFRQGAFQGSSASSAYFVKCDSETTTQTDINSGVVNIVVGFAPLKPAEFVILSIQQMAGQTAAS
jgi:phage tail sheath protein FI